MHRQSQIRVFGPKGRQQHIAPLYLWEAKLYSESFDNTLTIFFSHTYNIAKQKVATYPLRPRSSTSVQLGLSDTLPMDSCTSNRGLTAVSLSTGRVGGSSWCQGQTWGSPHNEGWWSQGLAPGAAESPPHQCHWGMQRGQSPRYVDCIHYYNHPSINTKPWNLCWMPDLENQEW